MYIESFYGKFSDAKYSRNHIDNSRDGKGLK